MKINLYDFDKTIYDGDSSTDFFFYSLMKYPYIIIVLPKMLLFAVLYLLKIVTKTRMKEAIFSFLKYIPNIDKHITSFWNTHECYIKDFYNEKDHSNDIIISASPEFLLKPISKQLGVKDMMASKVDKYTGKFNGLNCHDVEKVRRLNKKYKDYKVMESYSDSLSDTPILELAKKAYIVKGNKLIKFVK